MRTHTYPHSSTSSMHPFVEVFCLLFCGGLTCTGVAVVPRYESMERDEYGRFKREKPPKVDTGRLGPPKAWIPANEAAIAARVRACMCLCLRPPCQACLCMKVCV